MSLLDGYHKKYVDELKIFLIFFIPGLILLGLSAYWGPLAIAGILLLVLGALVAEYKKTQ